MKNILRVVATAAMLAGTTAFAQSGRGMGGPAGMSASMAKFFGDNKSFTANVEASMENPSRPGTMTMEMKLAMLDGKTRQEMDMSTIKGGSMPPAQVAQMKQMGVDKTVSIVRPDKKMSYVVFPNLKSYALMEMTDKQVADAMDESKIEKTSLGKETLDGHACEKNKMIVTDDSGEKHEVLVWNATDLKGFPVQIQTDEQGKKMTMKFKDVKLEKPDAKLFEPPTEFTKYDSMQAMQMEMFKRMSGGAAGAPPK
jgi:hypothetical protein